MIIDKKFKYVFNAFDFDKLYDLETDPGETVNLFDIRPSVNSAYSCLHGIPLGTIYNDA